MAKLLYDSTKNSDMRYALGMTVHDPTFLLEKNGKKFVFLDHREIGVFQGQNTNENIEAVPLNPFLDEAAYSSENTSLSNKVALRIIESFDLERERVDVSCSFPLDMADFLRGRGINVVPVSPFYPARERKHPNEVEVIRNALNKTSRAFALVERILRESIIEEDKILYQGAVLTSEEVKRQVAHLLLEEDMLNETPMILASGAQAAIPHHEGCGLILPNRTIICDIFPRDQHTKYHGDLTRTYVKGSPSLKAQEMYEAVIASQKAGTARCGQGCPAGRFTRYARVFCVIGGFTSGTRVLFTVRGMDLG